MHQIAFARIVSCVHMSAHFVPCFDDCPSMGSSTEAVCSACLLLCHHADTRYWLELLQDYSTPRRQLLPGCLTLRRQLSKSLTAAPPSAPSQTLAGRDMGMLSSGMHLPDHTASQQGASESFSHETSNCVDAMSRSNGSFIAGNVNTALYTSTRLQPGKLHSLKAIISHEEIHSKQEHHDCHASPCQRTESESPVMQGAGG